MAARSDIDSLPATSSEGSDSASSVDRTEATSEIADADSGTTIEGSQRYEPKTLQDNENRWRRRPARITTAIIVGLSMIIALVATAGWLGYRTYQLHRSEGQLTRFVQLGRQAALNLTTIDYQHADADVRRILDASTGTFHDDFANRSPAFLQVVKQVQSKSVGTVTEAGLQSSTADSAEVLVGVSVQTSNAGAPEQQPRSWRMRITVQQVGADLKVSDVEFVP